jgi:hypothetical protein
MSWYACAAETKDGGRCRNPAKSGDQNFFCAKVHAPARDKGRKVAFAPMPHTVLFQISINDKRATELRKAGIREIEPDFEDQEKNHIADAKRLGRDPFGFNKAIAASGVPVFGSNGLNNVSVNELLNDLFYREYRAVDVHFFKRKDNKVMYVLCMTFTWDEGDQREMDPLPECVDQMMTNPWGYCHVWANPPKENGLVVHVVNLAHRERDKNPEGCLRLADGLWAVDSVE